ncbi:hypothetical protein TI04_01490 [Achromatium sp. WMS2]|nr:hypothetical protein TI04_01490 [Achromatium sp. WMS2]
MNFTASIIPGNYQIQIAKDETILAAGIRHNLGLLYECRRGFCGTCQATLLSGEVSYPKGKPGRLIGADPNLCLMCQAVPLTDITLQVQELIGYNQYPEPQIITCTVHQKNQIAPDVTYLNLQLPAGQRLQFLAGQYLEIILDEGSTRPFSIANAPYTDTSIELHIRNVPNGLFTSKLLPEIKIGNSLQVRAPLGKFNLKPSERPLLFVAGGTGFSPIKGLIEQALQDNTERQIYLYWGVRSQPDLYMPDLPQRWSREYPNLKFIPVLSQPNSEWTGRSGFVHQAVITDHPQPIQFDAYLAGPPVMVNAAQHALTQGGLDPAHIFSDAFEFTTIQSN